MSLTDLGSQVRKLLRLPAQNLKAWGQVAAQPKLRQEYGQLVVKPAVKKAAAYVPFTSASRQRLATQQKQFQQQPAVQKAGVKIGQYFEKRPVVAQFTEQYLKPYQNIYSLFGGTTPKDLVTAKKPTTTREKVAAGAGGVAGYIPLYSLGGQLIEAPLAAKIPATLAKSKKLAKVTKFAAKTAGSTPMISTLTGEGTLKERLKRAPGEAATDVAMSALMMGALKPIQKAMPPIKIKGEKVVPEDLLAKQRKLRQSIAEETEMRQASAEIAKTTREMFSKSDIYDINRVKTLMRTKGVIEGDIETLRKKNPKLVNKVLESLIEKDPTITSEQQALEFLRGFPTKAETVVHRPEQLPELREVAKRIEEIKEDFYQEFGRPMSLKEQQRFYETEYKKSIEYLANIGAATKTTKAGKEIPIRRGGQAIKADIVASPEKMKDIEHLDIAFRDFYRNTEAVLGKKADVVLNDFDLAKKGFVEHQAKWLGALKTDVIEKLGINKQSKESKLTQMFGEGDISLAQLKKEAPKKWQNIVEADKWFRQAYNQLLDEVNFVYKTIGKDPIPKRKDYYRHFQELGGLKGLANVFESQYAIDPKLAGISDYTQPTAKWLSFAQQRLGIKTEKDAVGGFLNYIQPASYAINIDPQIGKIRALRDALAEQTGDTKHLNNYIEYLNDFANGLSGKTSPYDRPIQKLLGRKTFGVINWLNNRVKANAVLGNLRSSLSQILNMPQNIASAGPKNALAGAYEAATVPLTKEDFAVENSDFLKERFLYKKYQEFDVRLIDQPKKLAAWMLGVLDDYNSRATWLSHFRKGISEGMDEHTAIKYADRITRKLVGGRGIGEVPEVYQSKLMSLMAPFQLEVGNAWQVMRDFVSKKQFGKLMTLFVANWGFNEITERLFGDRILFDPIDVVYDNLFGEDKETGLAQKGGRFAGEILSNLPGGQMIAAGYPEYGISIGGKETPTRKELFGRRDPTRYGTGLLVAKGLQDPLFKIAPPWGGSQLQKTTGGIKLLAKGGEYGERKGEPTLKYPAPEGVAGKIQALAFGKWATPEARQYFESGSIPLGPEQTKSVEELAGKKGTLKDFWQEVLKSREAGEKPVSAAETIKISLPTATDDLSELYKKYKGVIDSKEKDLRLVEYEEFGTAADKQTRIRNLQEDLAYAQSMIERIEKERPNQVFDIQIDTYRSGSGQSVEDRAAWVAETLEGLEGKERQEMINRLWDEKVITTGASGVAQYLKDNFGLNVWGYTGTGKGGGKKSTKSAKAITIKKVTIPKLKVSGTVSRGNIPTLKIAKPPSLKTTAQKAPKLPMPAYKVPTIKVEKIPTLTVGRYR